MEKSTFFQDNAKEIGQRIKNEIKKNGFNNVIIGNLLGYSHHTISRKNNNKDGKYYTSDDIRKLAKIFKCNEKQLCNYDFNKNTLDDEINKSNYKDIINYLKSIGINLIPAFFWVGDTKQFNNAHKFLLEKDCLTANAKTLYNKHKKEIDNNKYNRWLFLWLNKNPIIEKYNVDLNDIKTKKIHDMPFSTILEKSNYKMSVHDMGVIEMRFILFYDNEIKTIDDSNFQTLGLSDVTNLFDYVDNMTKNSIFALLNTSITEHTNCLGPYNNKFFFKEFNVESFS